MVKNKLGYLSIGCFIYFSMPQDQIGLGQNAVAFVPAEIADFSSTQPIDSYNELSISKVGQNRFNIGCSPKNG